MLSNGKKVSWCIQKNDEFYVKRLNLNPPGPSVYHVINPRAAAMFPTKRLAEKCLERMKDSGVDTSAYELEATTMEPTINNGYLGCMHF